MKRSLLWTLLAFLLASCSSSNSEFSTQDIMFAEMMIPHHEQALVISDIALANTENSEVLDISERIKAAQAPEIEEMKSWPGVDAGAHMGHMMDGMLSDDEIEALKGSTGAEFDQLFLAGMIKHHQGAIEMAEMVTDSKNAEVAALAKSIIEAQQAEISEMQALLR